MSSEICYPIAWPFLTPSPRAGLRSSGGQTRNLLACGFPIRDTAECHSALPGSAAINHAGGIQHTDVMLTITEIQAKGEPADDGSGRSRNDGLVAP